MKRQTAIELLINLAKRDSDDAAHRLAAALSRETDAQKTLELLTQYHHDYADRFQQAMMKGMSTASHRNFESFLAKLDQAIVDQKEMLKRSQNSVNQSRISWQEHNRKCLSYDTLHKRQIASAQQKALKQDQKAMDEHASRSVFYRKIEAARFQDK